MNKNVPNILCAVRIALTPFVVWLVTDGALDKNVRLCVALGLFCLAMLTDLFDGKIARQYGLVSDMGKFLDPIADKMLILGTVLAFVAVGRFPVFAAFLMLAREFAVTGLRLIAAPKGAVIAANMAGKCKTCTQTAVLILLFIFTAAEGVLFDVPVWVGDALAWFCAAVTVVSAVPYFKQGLQYLKD